MVCEIFYFALCNPCGCVIYIPQPDVWRMGCFSWWLFLQNAPCLGSSLSETPVNLWLLPSLFVEHSSINEICVTRILVNRAVTPKDTIFLPGGSSNSSIFFTNGVLFFTNILFFQLLGSECWLGTVPSFMLYCLYLIL